jgi:hypothetical protein
MLCARVRAGNVGRLLRRRFLEMMLLGEEGGGGDSPITVTRWEIQFHFSIDEDIAVVLFTEAI